MNVLLAVFSCSSCSSTLIHHWPYFLNQKADTSVVIATIDKPCRVPEGVERIDIGSDTYIDGDHLPRRMLDTMDELLKREWDALILAEYDSVFFSRIGIENLEQIAAHQAGTIHADYSYYHNPWVFDRVNAQDFIEEGWKVIKEDICQPGSVHASPDVFFGLVCHRLNQPVQTNLWTEFSRNSLDCEGDLDRARFAYHSGVDIIHGIKHEHELEYILD